MIDLNEEITLNFTFDQDIDSFKCHKKEKIRNMLIVFSKIKHIELNSVYFLCDGEMINRSEKTFEQFGKNKKNYFSIVVNEYPKSVFIIFLYANDEYKVETESR